MRVRLPDVMALLLCSTSALGGVCLTGQKNDPENAFDFTNALIESWSWLKEGRQKIQKIQGADFENKDLEELATSIYEVMLAVKLATIDYRCAALIVEPFQGSKDEVIATAAKVAKSAYEALILAEENTVKYYRDILDTRDFKLGVFLDRLSELQASKNESWKLLLQVSVAACYVLVLVDEEGASTQFLRVSSSQREELKKRLVKEFGESVKDGAKAGQPALEGSAALLHQFLADSKWRSRDQVGLQTPSGRKRVRSNKDEPSPPPRQRKRDS